MFDSAPSTARLLYATGTRRRLYVRFFLRALLGVVAAIAAGLAVSAIAGRGQLPPLIANLLLLIAFLAGLWFAIRLVVQLVRVFTRRTVAVHLYDKGFLWTEKGVTTRHRWGDVVAFREGVRAVQVFGRRWLERGAHTITVENGREYRFTPAMGDADAFAQYVRPYAAHVTSLRMGRALNLEQPIKLSDKLVLYPGGVAWKRAEVPWAELRVAVDGDWSQITLRRVQPGVKPKVLARLPLYSIDNAGGFVEIARPMIESHSMRVV
jgi:hypothetical protein